MAQLDPNIIMGARPMQVEAPMNQLAKVMQVQGMQQQNQLGQMKMDQYKSETAKQNKLAALLQGQYATPEERESALLQGGFMDESQKLTKGRNEATTAAAQAEKLKLQTAMEKLSAVGQIMAGVKDQASYDQARAQAQAMGLDVSQSPPQYDPAMVEQKRQQALTMEQQLAQVWKQKGYQLDVEKFGEAKRSNLAGEGLQRRGQDITARGQNMTDARARERIEIDRTRPTNQPGGRKPMTAAQEAKYREEVAKDYQAANTNLANMNEVLTSIEEVRKAPGLDGATGVSSYFPSMPGGKAAEAEVRLKNLEGKITQLGKAAAAQGGAVGPMAVQEWKIVRDMIAAVEPAKGKQAMLDQIDLIEQTVIGAAERIKDVYSKQYSPDAEMYPQFQELTVPKSGPKGKPGAAPVSEQDKQAMEWAKANPNDPRSKAIMQKLGGR